jgi:hypothetical protein
VRPIYSATNPGADWKVRRVGLLSRKAVMKMILSLALVALLSLALAAYYGYPYAYSYAAYPSYPDPVYQPQTSVTVAPAFQYHLQSDGMSVVYSWVWIPGAPAPPPPPTP